MWANSLGGVLGISALSLGGGFFIGILLVWSVVWKAIALWKAAHAGSKWWFIALLIVNTVGILEILYIYLFSKKQSESAQ